jgi:rfaE bifunctional protein kinase chain/domain
MINEKTIEAYLHSSKKKKICVVGDIMLDQNIIGHVERISPETPIPILDIKSFEESLGGAANVAANIASLGASPFLIGIIGKKNWDFSLKLKNLLSKQKIESFLIQKNGFTSVKTRAFSDNHNIFRMDQEDIHSLTHKEEVEILSQINNHIKKFSAIILQDYNKGTLTPVLIENIIIMAKKYNVPVFVDPKEKNFWNYKNVDWIKPNKKETEKALNVKLNSDEDLISAANQLMEKLNCKNVVITLGDKGLFYANSNEHFSIKAIDIKVANVSGAGDTAIATLATLLSGKTSIKESLILANIAAGITCHFPKTYAIPDVDLIFNKFVKN